VGTNLQPKGTKESEKAKRPPRKGGEVVKKTGALESYAGKRGEKKITKGQVSGKKHPAMSGKSDKRQV